MKQDVNTLVHRDYLSTRPFAEVVAAFEAAIGSVEGDKLSQVTRESKSADEFAERVKKFEGSSGFMLFLKIEHGPWMAKAGLQGKGTLYILGNPLIAQTMIRYSIDVGLYVPVRMLVYADPETGVGRVAYDLPSSQLARLGDTRVNDAVKALDDKMAALAELVTGDKD